MFNVFFQPLRAPTLRRWWALSVAQSALVSLCLTSFWWFAGAHLQSDPMVWLYAITLVGFYFPVVWLLSLLLLPFGFWRLSRWLWIGVMTLLLALILLDWMTFNVYRFHINGPIVTMFVTDIENMGVPLFGWILLAMVLIGLWWGQTHLLHRAWRNDQQPILGLSSKGWFRVWLAGWFFFIISQVIHIWAYEHQQSRFTKFSHFFPLYMAVQSHSTAQWLQDAGFDHFEQTAHQSDWTTSATAQQHLRYPLQPVNCQTPSASPVVWIVLESWRADTIRERIMPFVHHLSQHSHRFTRHTSTGNATVPGLFGLFYGLYPSYYQSFADQALSFPPVWMKTLSQHGYGLHAYTSGDLSRFQLQNLFFPPALNPQVHYFDQGSTDKKDLNLVSQLTQDLAQNNAQTTPFFFVFLTSSHHGYDYPPEFHHFTPTPKIEGAYMVDKHADPQPYLNDYHNALRFLDKQIENIARQLKQQDLWENSWVVITGDHGEAFNQNGQGYWGHGSRYDDQQTHVPLLIKQPRQQQGTVVNHDTNHIDVVPTLMSHLFQCNTPLASFSHGLDLLSPNLPIQRSFVLSSYVGSAYYQQGWIQEKNLLGIHYPWSQQDAPQAQPTVNLLPVLEAESRFYQ